MRELWLQGTFFPTHRLSTRILSYARGRVGYPRFPPKQRVVKRLVMAFLCAALIAACAPRAGVAQPSPQSSVVAQNMFGGLAIDGIRCDTMEGAVEHIHAHLQLFDHGRALTVPALIGISQVGGCLYWLHTHASDGVIHIESPVRHPFTLGQFFDIWMAPLSPSSASTLHSSPGRSLSVWVNGKRWQGDPRKIVLRDHQEIVIANGPFASPKPYDWSRL
jgi:hypothetical protein